MSVHILTTMFLQTHLNCPPGKDKIEYCDGKERGLLIECRSGSAVPTWYWRRKENGKLTRNKLGTINDLSLDEARKRVALSKAERAVGRHAAPDQENDIPLDCLWTNHYQPYAKLHKRSHSRDAQLYRRIEPQFGPLPLKKITRMQVQQFQAALLNEGLSRATVNHHIQLMRRLLNLAISWEMV